MTAAPDLAGQWARELATAPASAVVAFAYRQLGQTLTLASAFGLEDVVLLHMACQTVPEPDVFCLDTDLLFPETYALAAALQERWHFRLRRIRPSLTLAEQAAAYGPRLWERDPDACCTLRKVWPLAEALTGYQGWMTGIRREQTPRRRTAQAVEWDARHALLKFNPLAGWSRNDVQAYLDAYRLPINPLHRQGYPSIGCWPCTRPVGPQDDPRSGRWHGFPKTECGIHR